MESFVVHLWVPGDDSRRATDTVQLRGSVCHVATGIETRFTEDRALLDVLHAAVAGRGALAAPPEGDPNPTGSRWSMLPEATNEGAIP